MYRVVAGTLVFSLFLFLLSMPMLHLHPAEHHDHDAVIHAHMPHAAGAHDAHQGNSSKEIGAREPSELQSVPIHVCALCPTDVSPAPDLAVALLPTFAMRIEPGPEFECVAEPESKAKSPPGFLIQISLRSPPA
jgi:hypothetical protein